jgi:hypothetical protein
MLRGPNKQKMLQVLFDLTGIKHVSSKIVVTVDVLHIMSPVTATHKPQHTGR